MVDVAPNSPGLIDMSFMASLECDLNCAHCMYASSTKTTERLDYDAVAAWVRGVDWSQIHACGFYGGEPSILLGWYARFIRLVPAETPKFLITSGSWSRDPHRTHAFIAFAHRYGLQVTVSGTRWHAPFQDRAVLERVALDEGYTLKGEEGQLIAMGRAKLWLNRPCTLLCQRWAKPWRIALHPTNGVIFQSCDGEYPKLQGLDEPFGHVLPNVMRLVRARGAGLEE